MSTVKANNHQIGQSGTATNNFTLYQPSTPDGTVRLAVGNSGATTGDVLSVSNTGLSVTGTLSATGNVSFDGGTFVFNESGADKDFRIEGDTEPNLFFTDASTDRVGIGTSSPGAKLDVNGQVRAYYTGGFQVDNAGSMLGKLYYSGGLVLDRAASTSLYFAQAGGNQATLDSSGNLGIGVAPSAWDTTNSVRALQLTQGAVWGYSAANMYLAANNYWNGTNRIYLSNNTAGEYRITGNVHAWMQAPLGTANTAITSFTQAMTLDASGNLLVGTTTANSAKFAVNAVPNSTIGSQAAFIAGTKTKFASVDQLPQGQLFVYDNAGTSAGTGGAISFGGDAGSGQQTWYAAIEARKDNSTAGDYGAAMVFYTRPSGTTAGERARITSGGEVYIAGTTDQGAYNLQVNGTGVWGAGAYVNGSDERLKDNIQTLNDGLAVVSQLRPVTFQYKPEHSKDQSVQPGFIAQELQQAMNGKAYLDGVVQSGPEYLNVAYQNLIPILTKAIQELKADLDATKAELAALKGTQP